ncbi:MAG: hypothetical protein KAS32_29175 [Candidatus Peribacteraceae bacterium]|nr:hypothetical protein [Candidatus Peribacteraceae bacterium]
MNDIKCKTCGKDALRYLTGFCSFVCKSDYFEGKLKAVEKERDDLIDWTDLMCDEFKRIKSCPGSDSEVEGLCERAIKNTIQHVPVIEQRDNMEKQKDDAIFELTQAKDRIEELQIDLQKEKCDFFCYEEKSIFESYCYGCLVKIRKQKEKR